MENYRLERLLQNIKLGTEVWLAIQISTQRKVAIKKVELHSDTKEGQRKIRHMIKREILIHKILYASVEETCKLYEVIWSPTHCYLILEYIDGVDFWDYLSMYSQDPKRWGEDSLSDRLFFFRKMVEIIWKLALYGVIHRDIKVDNFMISRKDRRIYIIDFDRSTWSPHGLSSKYLDQATYEMQPPEQLDPKTFPGGTVATSCSWALGALLFILISFANEWPFYGENLQNDPEYYSQTRKMILENQRKKVRIWARLYQNEEAKTSLNFSDQCIHASLVNHLVRSLLEQSPQKRWRFEDILGHPALDLKFLHCPEFCSYLPFHKQAIQEHTHVSRLDLAEGVSQEKQVNDNDKKTDPAETQSCTFQPQEYEFVFAVEETKDSLLIAQFVDQIVHRWKVTVPVFTIYLFPAQWIHVDDVSSQITSELRIVYPRFTARRLAKWISRDSETGAAMFQLYCWILFGYDQKSKAMDQLIRKKENVSSSYAIDKGPSSLGSDKKPLFEKSHAMSIDRKGETTRKSDQAKPFGALVSRPKVEWHNKGWEQEINGHFKWQRKNILPYSFRSHEVWRKADSTQPKIQQSPGLNVSQ
jgi:serine/threonine protein kinase